MRDFMDDDNAGSEMFQSHVSVSGLDSYFQVEWTLPDLQEIWPFSFKTGSSTRTKDCEE